MLRILPHVMNQVCFALKGGTAINLFIRDIPRLSVDIDLTYVPLEPREKSLSGIGTALRAIAQDIEKQIAGSRVTVAPKDKSEQPRRLLVAHQEAQVKIDTNTVVRGTVFPCEERQLVPSAETLFELSVSARTLSFADLFASKICAALDRQHPRDLFDVRLLLEKEGITDDIRKAFVVYLASHPRPMSELLNPKRLDFREVFEAEFSEMVAIPFEYEDLVRTQEFLIKTLPNQLTLDEKRFLISLKEGNPNFELLPLKGIENLPAIQWKLQNIRKMTPAKQEDALRKLRESLRL